MRRCFVLRKNSLTFPSSYRIIGRFIAFWPIRMPDWVCCDRETIGAKKNRVVRRRYLEGAIWLIDAELRLLDKKPLYPRLFEPSVAEPKISPLHWRATPTELAELLCALDFSGAVCNADGGKATFTNIVEAFEQLFDIRLGNPHDLKRNVLRRKTRLTVFLDKLRRLLNEYSSRF